MFDSLHVFPRFAKANFAAQHERVASLLSLNLKLSFGKRHGSHRSQPHWRSERSRHVETYRTPLLLLKYVKGS